MKISSPATTDKPNSQFYFLSASGRPWDDGEAIDKIYDKFDSSGLLSRE